MSTAPKTHPRTPGAHSHALVMENKCSKLSVINVAMWQSSHSPLGCSCQGHHNKSSDSFSPLDFKEAIKWEGPSTFKLFSRAHLKETQRAFFTVHLFQLSYCGSQMDNLLQFCIIISVSVTMNKVSCGHGVAGVTEWHCHKPRLNKSLEANLRR